MLQTAHAAPWRAETDPLVHPIILFFLPWCTERQVFPDLLLQMAPVSSQGQCSGSSQGNRIEGLGFRPQACTWFTRPSSNTRCLPAWLPSVPAQPWAEVFAPRNAQGSQAEEEAGCLLPTSKPGQGPSFQAHPFGSKQNTFCTSLLPFLGLGLWTEGATQ